ncbi:C10 family peptidase [Candidatus Electronema sp. JM]|uniref:C10 family peptidase n=1 Tax=Candidatus Electronema sp. JM TaxID=3401571 RepID=UPI003AA81E9E
MRHSGWRKKISRLSCALFVLLPASAGAVPTTAEQAERVVRRWLALDQRPLETELGSAIAGMETYKDQDGHPLYYVVNLSPKGFVIISGDTEVEPVIAFAPQGKYDPSEAKPLGALVSRDLPGRVHAARAAQAAGSSSIPQKAAANGSMSAPQKWDWLGQEASNNIPSKALGLPFISDVRVAPLLQSKWNQEGIYNSSWQYINLYNLYTPNNYPSGCVATALSQVMRYFAYPTASVGAGTYTVTVDGVPQTTALRGGNGTGGAYSWSDMPYVPNGYITSTQQNAIGSLLHDAGASVCMSYAASGSGAYITAAGKSLVNIFGYSNSINASISGWGNIPESSRTIMTNTNLDAGHPVLYAIDNDSGTAGHAVACDGYGYNASSIYHHLNMGWGGNSDVWYNLPTIDANAWYNASIIYEVIYNIYPSGSGEIISGRITDASGNPLSGVNITAARMGGGYYYASTNDNGIYALAKIPSASSYTVSPSKVGYVFQSQTISTGTSVNAFDSETDPCAITGYRSALAVGNVWGVNFTALLNAPEIDVRGNGSSIPNGNSSPSKSDYTDFGATLAGTSVSRTYTIANIGGVTLLVNSVTRIGSACSDFSITASPAASVAAGGTTTFTITYRPTVSGANGICTISIGNNDSNENPYTFTIKGVEGIEKIPGWLPAVYKLLM